MLSFEINMQTIPAVTEQLKKLLEKQRVIKANLYYRDLPGATIRRITTAFDGSLMIYRPGARRYGYFLPFHQLNKIEVSEPKTEDKAVVWKKSWEKVAARLEASGLWSDSYAKTVSLALEIGHEKITKAYTAYWKSPLSYTNTEQVDALREIDPRLVYVNDLGQERPYSDIIFYCRYPAKIKKMYFGRYENQGILREIAEALRDKKPIHVNGFASYDVSFEYNPDVNKAWYSEEYKNMGNGHYYLALDSTHAVFYEDD